MIEDFKGAFIGLSVLTLLGLCIAFPILALILAGAFIAWKMIAIDRQHGLELAEKAEQELRRRRDVD